MNRTDNNIILSAGIFAGFWVLCYFGWFVAVPLWGLILLVWTGIFTLFALTENISVAVPMIMSIVTMFLLYLVFIRRAGLR